MSRVLGNPAPAAKTAITRIAHSAAVVILAAGCLVIRSSPAAAQAPSLHNSMIEIAYEEPSNRYLQPMHERMKKREVLEEFQQFLAPLRLPIKLKVTMKACGQSNAFYQRYQRQGIVLCYEYLDFFDRFAPADKTAEGFTREDALVGSVVDTLLHEMGHAVFDLLNVPIFGREEDAADQIAAFIMLQFGPEVARRAIGGNAYAWRLQASEWPRTLYSDTHGNPLQRYYNYLCIGYGGDPDTFKHLVESGVLPKARADNCVREYRQIRHAFLKTIDPHIDQELVKLVRARDWLRPGDGR